MRSLSTVSPRELFWLGGEVGSGKRGKEGEEERSASKRKEVCVGGYI